MSESEMQVTVIAEWVAPGNAPCGLAFDGQHIWYSDADLSSMFRLNAKSGKIEQRIALPEVRADLAFDGSCLWQVVGRPKALICVTKLGVLLRRLAIRPATERACGLTFPSPDLFWLAIEGDSARLELRRAADGAICRLIPARPRVAGLAAAFGLIWYTEHLDGILVACDPITGHEVATYRLPGNPTGLAFVGDAFVYADYPGQIIRKIQTAAVEYPT